MWVMLQMSHESRSVTSWKVIISEDSLDSRQTTHALTYVPHGQTALGPRWCLVASRVSLSAGLPSTQAQQRLGSACTTLSTHTLRPMILMVPSEGWGNASGTSTTGQRIGHGATHARGCSQRDRAARSGSFCGVWGAAVGVWRSAPHPR